MESNFSYTINQPLNVINQLLEQGFATVQNEEIGESVKCVLNNLDMNYVKLNLQFHVVNQS